MSSRWCDFVCGVNRPSGSKAERMNSAKLLAYKVLVMVVLVVWSYVCVWEC